MTSKDSSELNYPEAAALYEGAVSAALSKVIEDLTKTLESGIKFPEPLPPAVAKAAILQAIMLSAVAFAKTQEIPYLIVEDVLRVVGALSKSSLK